MRSILAQYMPLPDAEPGDEGGALLPPRGKFGARGRGGGGGGAGSAGFYAPPPASAGAAGFHGGDEERGATEMSAPKAGPLGGPL